MPRGGLRIGALARNADVAAHPLVVERCPVLAQALLGGASPQLRNAATIGGNLMQRTRCQYFYDPAFPSCNKRKPGSGCGALRGFNRMHAVLGHSEHCVATNPSDMNVALAALDAIVRVQGAQGSRDIPIGDFHRLPGDTPHIETALASDELIVSIDLPERTFAKRSSYLKVRDRATYAFALVSVAAALDVDDGGTIRDARVVLGGVAQKPWRATGAERELVGRRADEHAFSAAANVALADAQPLAQNAFKVELARRTVVRALTITAALV
jgi:xanthine dehydrogenase YagS FAD-binding subunit